MLEEYYKKQQEIRNKTKFTKELGYTFTDDKEVHPAILAVVEDMMSYNVYIHDAPNKRVVYSNHELSVTVEYGVHLANEIIKRGKAPQAGEVQDWVPFPKD